MNRKIDRLTIDNKTYIFDTPLILEYEKTDEWGECYVNETYAIIIPVGTNIEKALSHHFSFMMSAYLSELGPEHDYDSNGISHNMRQLFKI